MVIHGCYDCKLEADLCCYQIPDIKEMEIRIDAGVSDH